MQGVREFVKDGDGGVDVRFRGALRGLFTFDIRGLTSKKEKGIAKKPTNKKSKGFGVTISIEIWSCATKRRWE